MTTRLHRQEIGALCAAGSLAPSGGNAQPWRVTASGDRLVVRVDPTRGSFLDVHGYASYLALGCFTENVTLAARALGLAHAVSVREGAVTVTFTGRTDPGPPDDALERRVTNRKLHKGPPLREERVRRVTAVAEPPFSVVTAADPAGRRTVAEALGQADAIRMRHRVMFDDMMREICWSSAEARARRDGLELGSLELPAAGRVLLPVLRRLPWTRRLLPAARLGDTARAFVLGSSHVCCLATTAPPTPDTMVEAGRVVQRIWLAATRGDVALHPWTVSTLELLRLEVFGGEGFTSAERGQVARMGALLRTGFDVPAAAWPVFVFRLSAAPPAAARSMRQRWETFTTIQEAEGD